MALENPSFSSFFFFARNHASKFPNAVPMHRKEIIEEDVSICTTSEYDTASLMQLKCVQARC